MLAQNEVLWIMTPNGISSFSKIQNDLLFFFWYWLSQAVLEKRLLNECCCHPTKSVKTLKGIQSTSSNCLPSVHWLHRLDGRKSNQP